MKIYTLLLISSLTLLGSCGIYDRYTPEKPELLSDNLYREVPSADTSNLGNLSWRDLFTDPLLQTLIEKGLANNADLRVAQQTVIQAEAVLVTARLAYLPTFNFAAEGVASRFKGTNTHTYSLPIVASWELDIFGKISNKKRRAKAAYLQSKAYEQAVQTGLIAGIANTYYTLLMLDSQLETSRTTAQSWQENVAVMEALKESGMANEAAVSQMRATWYAIEASLFDLKRQIYEVENTLSLLLSTPPATILRSRLSDQTFPEQLSVGIPIQLLSNRPDVRSAALQLQQAFYLTEEARAALYPSLVLNGNLGWTNNAGNIILNPGGLLLAGIASLTQPVFKQGALKANLKITKAQQEQARLAFQQSILNAATEVINALKQIETAQAKTIFRYQQITALKTTVQSTELLMRHGSSTYLEVLTAKQGLLTAQLDEINDRFEEIQGIMKLYHALGGGGSNEGRSLAGASGMADRVRHDGLATVSGNTSIPSPDYFLFYRL